MKLLLLSDFSPTKYNEALFNKGDIDTLFSDTVQLFDDCDLSFINLECALTTSDGKIDKFGPCLKTHPSTAALLKRLGVDYCCLSNNHFFDFGKKGALDSLAALDAEGLVYTGFGKDEQDSRRDLVIEQNGERITVINVCEHEYSYALPDRMGCRPFDAYDTMADIRSAAAKGGRVIVIYHGGKEYCPYPSPRLHKLCHAMVDNGADLVLCQHSHGIGCFEEYQGGQILYGQGNFHFVEPSHVKNPECWYSALALFFDTESGEVTFIPLVSNEQGIELAKGERAEKIMKDFQARNQTLLDGTWRQGWHDFCEGMRATYTECIAKAFLPDATPRDNHRFAHFLDCEAHHDVWCELFPTANLTNERD